MAKQASREVIESLGAFLRRNTQLSDDVIRAQMKDLEEGRLRMPDSSETFRHPAIPSSADASRHAEPAASRDSNPSDDPRLAALRDHCVTDRTPITYPAHALRATEASADDVCARLAHLSDYVAMRIRVGELPCVDLPDTHRANTIHDPRGNVFLGHNVRRLALDHQSGSPLMRLLLTLEMASNNVRSGVCTTKRGLYYYHREKLADGRGDQLESDRALAALANVLGVRRRDLGFVEARRGILNGRLVIRDGAQIVDLSQMARGGYPVPRFTDDVEIISSDAAFVLVVEKQSVGFRLAQDRWWESVPCVIVTSEGLPSVSAREFVRLLVDTLGIPALICADADPGGIQLALTYAHGSISTGLETPWLACNNVWWAGLCPSDIERHCRTSDQIRLSDEDREAARLLLEHPSRTYVNDRVRNEIAILVDRGSKVELDPLAIDMRLVDDYLPKKIFESDLVKV